MNKTKAVRVAVLASGGQVLDYRLPTEPEPALVRWQRVLVPLGARRAVGIVIATDGDAEPGIELKPILERIDDQALFADQLGALLEFAARYYQTSIAAVLNGALPLWLRSGRPLVASREAHYQLSAAGRAALAQPSRKAPRLRSLLEALQSGPRSAEQLDPEARRRALQRGLIEALAAPAPLPIARLAPIALNPLQQQAVDEVSASLGTSASWLLWGVTGAGKTEVYLDQIARCQAGGAKALLLVPEIGLADGILARIVEASRGEILLYHSAIADGERARIYARSREPGPLLVIGTRSALFLPLAGLGLIIVDEEHDGAYKQQEGVRYSARDLALMRGQCERCPVVLGSATPSLAALELVRKGKLKRLDLPSRALGASMPTVSVVDLRQLRLHDGLAMPTLKALDQCVAAGQQALLFLNRRGYAPIVQCTQCGHVLKCRRCDASVTWHLDVARLICHHCAAERALPGPCPACKANAWHHRGIGTERLEQALAARYPDLPVVRIDRDSTRNKGAFTAQLNRAAHHEGPAVLVGTQMLAKGHDLPRLQLAVVLEVDGALRSADYHAPERLIQLLVQVCGRAGRRANPGQVLIQSYDPEHGLLQTLLRDGYGAAAQVLLDEREALELPPRAAHALIRAESRSTELLDGFLRQARVALDSSRVRCHGPLPRTIGRIAHQYRAQLLLEAASRHELGQHLSAHLPALRALDANRRVRWQLDIDPITLA